MNNLAECVLYICLILYVYLPECSVGTEKVSNSHPILIPNLIKIQNQTSRK